MEIVKSVADRKAVIEVIGRLDTTTAPQLEAVIKELSDVDELCLDLKQLDYISSAGLRVLLMCQKTMAKKGGLVVKNVNEEVGEVFELTGFSDILTIE